MSGTLFIISAPSGAGKTSLVKAVTQTLPNVSVSISHTTRKPRLEEKEGVNYFFISNQTFLKMQEQNEFLEHATVFNHAYGTAKSWIDETLKQYQDVILEIDWQGAKQVRKKLPGTVSIFILPPSLTSLKERLNNRGQDSPNVIAERLSQAKSEIKHFGEYDYIIVNDNFEQSTLELQAIITSYRLKRENQKKQLTKLISSLCD